MIDMLGRDYCRADRWGENAFEVNAHMDGTGLEPNDIVGFQLIVSHFVAAALETAYRGGF